MPQPLPTERRDEQFDVAPNSLYALPGGDVDFWGPNWSFTCSATHIRSRISVNVWRNCRDIDAYRTICTRKHTNTLFVACASSIWGRVYSLWLIYQQISTFSIQFLIVQRLVFIPIDALLLYNFITIRILLV